MIFRSFKPTPQRVILYALMVLGVSVALAPTTGSLPVLIAIAAVTISIPPAVLLLFFRARARLSLLEWLSLIAMSIAVIRMSSLGIAQLFHDNPAVIWNVDGRYFATLAWTIEKFGNLSQSLEYSGVRANYHAGPSWIAGALAHWLDVHPNIPLFLVTPALATFGICLGALVFLRNLGVPRSIALFSIAIVLNIPKQAIMFVSSLYGLGFKGLIHWYSYLPEYWFFSSNLMLNSLFAFSIMFVGAALSTSSKAEDKFLGIVGLICLASLKPQAMVAAVFMMCLPITSLALIQSRHSKEALKAHLVPIVIASITGFILMLPIVSSESGRFIGFDFDLDRLRELDIPYGRIDWIFLSTSTLALVTVIGRCGTFFHQKYTYFYTSALLGLIFLYFALKTCFPISPSWLVDRAQAVGFSAFSQYTMGKNFSQSIMFATTYSLILAIPAATIIAQKLIRSLFHRYKTIPNYAFNSGMAFVLLLSTAIAMPVTINPIIDPKGKSAYEWTDELELYELLQKVDTAAGLFLMSDYKRPLRPLSTTSLSSAEFYIANIGYDKFMYSDSATRLSNAQRFFSQNWSHWHDQFVSDNGIRYLLINDRCIPRWSDHYEAIGKVIRGGEKWLAIELNINTSNRFTYTSEPRLQNLIANQYGKAPCLSAR
jgi:hypothetical protein